MSILYYNNCWFTNVGEAFIDIGAVELIKKLFPSENIINFSNMSDFYLSKYKADLSRKNINILRMNELLGEDVKCVILAGMFACDEYINSHRNVAYEYAEKGIPLIYLGLGQCKYNNEETENFKRFLKKTKPALLVSRDDVVYDNFVDYVPIIKGLDCAYWVKDSYNPSKCKPLKKYDVLTYNRSAESERALSLIDKNYVRAWHMQYYLQEANIKDNMLISDSPYDYLSLYACADKVYTDLVHATIPSLQYGKHVLFERVDKRGYAIDALEYLKKDEEGRVFIEEKDLEKQKDYVVSCIKQEIKYLDKIIVCIKQEVIYDFY